MVSMTKNAISRNAARGGCTVVSMAGTAGCNGWHENVGSRFALGRMMTLTAGDRSMTPMVELGMTKPAFRHHRAVGGGTPGGVANKLWIFDQYLPSVTARNHMMTVGTEPFRFASEYDAVGSIVQFSVILLRKRLGRGQTAASPHHANWRLAPLAPTCRQRIGFLLRSSPDGEIHKPRPPIRGARFPIRSVAPRE